MRTLYENSPKVNVGLIATMSAIAIFGAKNSKEENINKKEHEKVPVVKFHEAGMFMGKTVIRELMHEHRSDVASKKHHKKVSLHYDPPLPNILKRIGGCETRNSPYAKIDYTARNPHSSASGGFQITYGTWDHYMGYNEAIDAPKYVQDRKAIKLLHESGTNPWISSKYCWG